MNILLAPVSKEHIESSLLRQQVEIPVEFQLKSFSKCLESDLKIGGDMRKRSGLISKLSGAEPNQNSSLQFYEAAAVMRTSIMWTAMISSHPAKWFLNLAYLVDGLTVSTPPVSPVVDVDHFVLRDLLADTNLEYPPQLRPSQHLVSLKYFP